MAVPLSHPASYTSVATTEMSQEADEGVADEGVGREGVEDESQPLQRLTPSVPSLLPFLLLCCGAFLAGYLAHSLLSGVSPSRLVSTLAESLPASLLPFKPSAVNWSAELRRIPREEVCDGRHWDELITAILTGEGRPTSTPFVGHRRLYRTLLKVLCGHPIIMGVSGTSVSAGHGVDFDTRRVYAALVWQWLMTIPLLPQASPIYHQNKLSHGYRNTAVGGLGSDLTSLCLTGFWSNTTGIFNNYAPPSVDPSPDPFAETSTQMAERVGASNVVADLLFVEFVANDYRWAKLKHVDGGSLTFTWNYTNAAEHDGYVDEGEEPEEAGDEVKMDPRVCHDSAGRRPHQSRRDGGGATQHHLRYY